KFGGIGMRFGLEEIQVDGLIDPDAENPCSAYVWSPDEKLASWKKVNSFLAEIPVPNGFSNHPVAEGYIYTATLPTLIPEDFAKPVRLREALCDPLSRLLDWYNKNAKAIHQFQPKKAKKD